MGPQDFTFRHTVLNGVCVNVIYEIQCMTAQLILLTAEHVQTFRGRRE
jgi:hypothetical protein